MNISPAFEGFLRGLGVVVLVAVLSYIGNATNLSFLNPSTASLIAGLALWAEKAMSPSGTSFFGAIKS